ncbi:MAG: ribosome biogenesis GTPase Der [Dokdonella sp.]|uniref:ribosome biogenesis GTPase Der n=1 Tax=Dokdonella sp. TaxID=2291710 RepID=UPI0025C47D07|nr:ribosome biogenesis GTPase Der [Dokdonella sp.]MBX3701596.1 ribosome biogenesis GTPase Der [Dokdonella sp.]
MLPVVALVGRPNVGKSTLFNVLTRTRDALVHDLPGVTRDRHYGVCRLLPQRAFAVVDTGGFVDAAVGLDAHTARQAELAMDEADIVLLIVDARDGLLPTDRAILDRLRRGGKPTLLVVNKVDGLDEHAALADFSALGVAQVFGVAAAHGRGMAPLLEAIGAKLPAVVEDELAAQPDDGIRIAIIGRPNAGKSTLVNRLLGEERVITSEVAGTTRDAIRIPLERDGRRYTLIDTAGVRRRARIEDALEKFSVIKALQSVEAAHVTVMMLDAREGVSEQDTTLLGHVLESGRALVIAVNKWDDMDKYQRDQCVASLSRRLDFVAWARQVFISALHGSGIGELMKAIHRAYAASNHKFTSSELTRAIAAATAAYQPPLVRGHSPRLKFAHPTGTNPPSILIHGARTRHISDGYRRYLENFLRKRYRLEGTPIRIEFRDGENPFAGKRNELTEGQQRRRTRMIRNARRGKD